jgi:small subunit ribosomal protein S16
MAVMIRLQRHGTRNTPFYHIVAMDRRKAAKGSILEKLGYYDPKISPSTIEFKEDRVQFWYNKGAVLTSAVNNIMKKKNVKLGKRENTNKNAKPKK